MNERPDPTIDDCAHEPIHLAGAIQPHGYLVSCTLADWTVQHVSANIEALFGTTPEAVLGRSLRELIEDEVLQVIADTVAFSEDSGSAQRAGEANIGHRASICDLTVHVAGGLLHLEIEPQPFRMQELAATGIAQSMIARVGATPALADLYQRTAEQVRLLTGFDRVMVYRFRHDDSGDVIAESCSGDLEPYLGLRYPASDIPPQARALYLRNRLRVIPDAGYTAVGLLPPLDAAGAPLDLSQHVLRSVSPVHLEYLHNMGVAASMSISIVSGGRLWGLIACHHQTPRRVPSGVRAVADLFGMFVSMRVSTQEHQDRLARYEDAQQIRDALAQRLSLTDDFDAALVEELELLCRTFDSDGALLWLGGKWHASGRVPGATDPRPLLDWLQRQDRPRVGMTERAEDWNVPSLQAQGLAGVMAIRLDVAEDWLFVFRTEQIEQGRGAGEPRKALMITDDGQRIAPRKSFATWRETVRGRSLGWTDSDLRGAERLYRVLREQRRRASAQIRTAHDPDSLHHRQGLKDQQQRLNQIATLLDGLVDLDSAQTSRIGSSIARLEADLVRLMRRSSESVDSGIRSVD